MTVSWLDCRSYSAIPFYQLLVTIFRTFKRTRTANLRWAKKNLVPSQRTRLTSRGTTFDCQAFEYLTTQGTVTWPNPFDPSL